MRKRGRKEMRKRRWRSSLNWRRKEDEGREVERGETEGKAKGKKKCIDNINFLSIHELCLKFL